MNGQFSYRIVADVDKASFNEATKSILTLLNDLETKRRKALIGGEDIDLKSIETKMQQLNDFLGLWQSSFNKKLGVLNLNKFNTELEKSGHKIKDLYQTFQSEGAAGITAFRQLTAETLSANRNLEKTATILDTIGTTMGNTIKWGISSSLMNSTTGAVQKAYGYVKNLDKSLNNIRIVAEKSADEMERFSQSANKAAQNLGATTLDYTNASLIYYQQGLSEEDVQARTATTIKMANALGASASEVSDYMTAIWNNFAKGGENLEYYADVITKLGAATASSAEEISTGLEKFAAIADTVGLSYEYATAALTTVTATTRQSAEVVGTAFKTLFARIQDLELGKTLEDGITLGKYSEALKSVGIDILTANGEMKEMDEILDSMGSKWDSLTQAQKVSLAQTVAGTRQYTQLVALMDNWKTFQDNVSLAEGATGTLNQQQDVYLDSVEAHLNSLSAAWEDFYNSMLDEDTIKSFAKMLTGLAQQLTGIIDSVGGGENAFLGLAGTGLQLFKTSFARQLGDVASNMGRKEDNFQTGIEESRLREKYKEAKINDVVIQKIIKYKEAYANFGKLVTDEQQNELDTWIDILVKAENEKTLWEEKLDLVQQFRKELGYLAVTNEKELNNILDSDDVNIAWRMQEQNDIDVHEWEARVQGLKQMPAEQRIAAWNRYQEESFAEEVDIQNENIGFTNNFIEEIAKQMEDVSQQNITNSLKDYFIKAEEVKRYLDDLYNELLDYDKNPLLSSGAVSFDSIITANQGYNSMESALYTLYDELSDRGMTLEDLTEQQSKEFSDSIRNLFLKFTADAKASVADIQKQTQSLEKQLPDMIDTIQQKDAYKSEDVENSIVAAMAPIEQSIKKFNTSQAIEEFLALTGAINQTIFAFNTLANIPKILSNEDLTSWEKFSQLISALLQAVGTGVMAYTTFATSIKAVKAQIISMSPVYATKAIAMKLELDATDKQIQHNNMLIQSEKALAKAKLNTAAASGAKSATEEAVGGIKNLKVNTKGMESLLGSAPGFAIDKTAKGTQTLAGGMKAIIAKATPLLGKLALVAGAIAAVGVAIYAVIKIYNKDADAAKKAAERAEEAQKAYESVRTAYANTVSEMSKYGDAVNALNKLKEGTVEWKQAVLELNEQVIALIDKYPELADAVKVVNGALYIDDPQAINNLLDKQYAQVQQALRSKNIADMASNDADLQAEKTKFRRSITYKDWVGAGASLAARTTLPNAYIAPQRSVTQTMSEEELDKLLKAMKKDDDLTFLKDEKSLQKATGIENDKLIKALWENKEEIIKLNTSIRNNTAANEKLPLINAQSYLAEKSADYRNLSTLDQEKAAKRFVEQSKKQADELDKSKYYKSGWFSGGYSDKEIHEQYRQMMGYKKVKKGWNIGDATFEDAEGNEIKVDDKVQREALKQQKSMELALAENKKTIERLNTMNSNITKALEESGKVTGKDIEITKNILQTGYQSDGNFDFSTATDEQMAAMQDLYDSGKFKEIITKDDEIWKDAGYKSADEYLKALDEKLKEWSTPEKQQERAKNLAAVIESEYQAKLAHDAADLEISSTALDTYTKRLMETNEELKNDKLAAEAAAVASFKFAKGVKDLGDALNKNEQLLKDWKNGLTDSTEAYEAVAQVQEAVEKMFGIKVSKNFVKDHLEDLTKVANGDVEALKELEKAAAKDYVAHLTISGTEKEIADARKVLNDGLNKADLNLKVGAELDDAQFKEKLQAMIDNGQLTSEQVQSYLNSIGYTPEFEEASAETKPQEITTISKLHYDTRFGTAELGTLRTTTSVDGVNATMFGISNTENKKKTIKSIKKTSDTGSRQRAVANAGASGKKVGKGGGSKPKVEDLLKDEKDRYHDVNVELAQINNNLEKAQTEMEQLVGQDKIDNLREQYALLNQEIEKTADKIGIAKDEMKELQGKLGDKGVSFNADGTIANYAAAYDAQMAYVNSVINQYNAMSEDGQEAFQATLDKAKEDFETFKENIENYDNLLTDTIPGLEADIQDAINKQIELKIDAFHQEIEIRLEMAEAERDWNEFYKNIIKDIEEDDILGNVTERLKDFISYYKEGAEGIIQVNTEHINQILSELKAMDEGGVANIYGKDDTEYRKQALEDLKNYYEQLMSDLTDIHDLSDEIHESYVDMIDEAQEKFDEQIETFERVNELLEHDKNVISMIYGEDSYSILSQYYDKQEENYNKQLDFQKQQVEFWQQQMTIAEEGSDAWEAAKENWISAVDEWNAAVESAIENLQDKYLNAINAVFQNLNNQVTNGLGLDYTETQWELINKNADQYLDSVNAIYKVQELQNKYLDAIEKTDSPAQQKRLNELMQQETDYLREQDKLSEYDLERANLKYEIALKQMALEEAQQNKTQLRLRRDSQGNYTYQYTADEDQVSSIQQEIADLYNQLYNLDAEAYRGNLEEIYDVWVEFQEKMAEAAQINDPEQRAQKELLLKEQYGELINTLVEKNENTQANLYQSTMSHLFDLYNQNIVNYDEMSEEQRQILDQFMSAETDLSNAAFDNLFNLYNVNIESFKDMTAEQQEILMGSLVPQWDTAVQAMVDNIIGAGGFVPTCKDAFEEIDAATQDYMTGLEELQKSANVSFDELKEGIDNTIIETEKLLEDNNELITSYEKEIEAIRGVIDELEELISKYEAASDAAKKATEDAYNYWLAEQDKNATIDSTLPDPNEGVATTDNTPVETKAATATQSPPSLNYGSFVDVKPGARWYSNSAGGGTSGPAQSGTISIINGNSHGYHIIGSQYGSGWIKKSDIVGYDTGGYTGEWSSKDGRLAMLHQKELVLNANDTTNILNAVEILRDITNNLGNALFSKMASITAAGAQAMANGIGSDALEQNVHIEAQFPNVTNSHEVEDALNNLMNRASQFIQQSR